MGVKERFLVWDRGQRLAFAIEATTLPLVNQMIEEMCLEHRARSPWRDSAPCIATTSVLAAALETHLLDHLVHERQRGRFDGEGEALAAVPNEEALLTPMAVDAVLALMVSMTTSRVVPTPYGAGLVHRHSTNGSSHSWKPSPVRTSNTRPAARTRGSRSGCGKARDR